jgi:hypothetical protein
LARVAGRSPLEYLGDVERRHQVRTVLGLLPPHCAAPADFIGDFTSCLSSPN